MTLATTIALADGARIPVEKSNGEWKRSDGTDLHTPGPGKDGTEPAREAARTRSGQTEYRYRGDTARIAFNESTFRLAIAEWRVAVQDDGAGAQRRRVLADRPDLLSFAGLW